MCQLLVYLEKGREQEFSLWLLCEKRTTIEKECLVYRHSTLTVYIFLFFHISLIG